jgi:carbon monoxide dehydrogenase subunit G
VRIEGTRSFAASRERVWDALVDPQLLGEFLPGLESLKVKDEAHWSAVMRLPMSPISLSLNFELVERSRPGHAVLTAKGKRLGASADVRTTFDLAEAASGTTMAWSADVELGGMLGRLAPAMRPVAQHQAEKFLDKLERKLET